jgi:hypothetical protein
MTPVGVQHYFDDTLYHDALYFSMRIANQLKYGKKSTPHELLKSGQLRKKEKQKHAEQSQRQEV